MKKNTLNLHVPILIINYTKMNIDPNIIIFIAYSPISICASVYTLVNNVTTVQNVYIEPIHYKEYINTLPSSFFKNLSIVINKKYINYATIRPRKSLLRTVYKEGSINISMSGHIHITLHPGHHTKLDKLSRKEYVLNQPIYIKELSIYNRCMKFISHNTDITVYNYLIKFILQSFNCKHLSFSHQSKYIEYAYVFNTDNITSIKLDIRQSTKLFSKYHQPIYDTHVKFDTDNYSIFYNNEGVYNLLWDYNKLIQ